MTRKSAHTAVSADDPTTTVALPANEVPVPEVFKDGGPLPKMIVFDLDFTLWPLWCDTHVDAPVKANPKDGGLTIRDSHGATYGFYNDVAGLLLALKERHITIGVASRTCTPDLAHKMLSLLRLAIQPSSEDDSVTNSANSKPAISVFDHLEMYPGSKKTHFRRLQKSSGHAFEEMLFFDDESRNRDVESLGVVMQLVRDGVTRNEVNKGVWTWRERNKKYLEQRELEREAEAREREG